MRFNNKLKKEKIVFVWFPVIDCNNSIVWFENMRRIPIYADGVFQYYVYKTL